MPTENGTHVYAVGETEKGFTANALALDTLTAGLTLLNSQSTGWSFTVLYYGESGW